MGGTRTSYQRRVRVAAAVSAAGALPLLDRLLFVIGFLGCLFRRLFSADTFATSSGGTGVTNILPSTGRTRSSNSSFSSALSKPTYAFFAGSHVFWKSVNDRGSYLRYGLPAMLTAAAMTAPMASTAIKLRGMRGPRAVSSTSGLPRRGGLGSSGSGVPFFHSSAIGFGRSP